MHKRNVSTQMKWSQHCKKKIYIYIYIYKILVTGWYRQVFYLIHPKGINTNFLSNTTHTADIDPILTYIDDG